MEELAILVLEVHLNPFDVDHNLHQRRESSTVEEQGEVVDFEAEVQETVLQKVEDQSWEQDQGLPFEVPSKEELLAGQLAVEDQHSEEEDNEWAY